MLTFLSLLLMATAALYGQEEIVAIKAGKILTVSSAPVTDGVILIENGKIAEVGTGKAIPEGATIIDASDSVIIPGLVDAKAVPAVRGDLNEQSNEITPAFRISSALNPQSKELKRIIQTGVTTLYIPPGGQNLIGGLGVVVKPVGKTAAEMIIKDDAALKIVMGSDSTRGNRIPWRNHPTNFYYRRPATRMAVAWMLRKSFFDAQQYAASHEKEDPDMEVLSAVLKGEIPIRVTVRRAIDIRTAFRIADEYGLQLILDECTEGYKVAKEIAEKRAPVVLGPFYYYPKTSSQYTEGRKVNWNNAGILANAGVKVALASGAQPESIDLLTAATFAVRHGMPCDEALKAITLTPAEIVGVAERVGSLEKGKDADLVILTGEPFKIQSTVDKTLINGRIVYACPAAETKKEAVEESLTAIRARKIFTGSRGQINDGFILIRGSKIAYVGKPKAIPQEAIVVDASESVVIPGMIDIHSHLGLHWESEPMLMNPSAPTSGPGSSKLHLVSIANSIAPNDEGFQEVLRSGVTSVLLAPETRGLVSGNAALIKLAGGSMQDMIVKEYAVIKFSMLGERAKLARIWEARDLLKKAKEYAEKWDEYERKVPEYKHRKATDKEGVVKEPDRPKRDANLELLRRLFKHEMAALVHANRADEIRNALRVFRDEYNLDVIILGGDDSYRVTPELRRYNVGVAIGPNIIRYEKGKPVNNADLLTKNGLRVAFHTSATSGTQYLPMNAAYAVRYGMDEGKAFQAITSYPAELLHVNDRIGSIDVGKDADLVILSGEPFDFTSQVKKVFVNGRIVFERAE